MIPGRRQGDVGQEPISSYRVRGPGRFWGGYRCGVKLMSGIGIVLAVAGWVLFGVTLLALVGLLSVGLGWTEAAEATADRDAPPKGIDFDRDPEARRRFVRGEM
jgi:hypothetical protein